MRLVKLLFSLAALVFTSIILRLVLFSSLDYGPPKLRQSSIDHTVIPCGERELHDEMVQFITEYEPRYLRCLLLEREDRDFRSVACANFKGHTDMIRRLHKLRNEQERELQIIQIGAMDGKTNDPLFHALYQPHLPDTGRSIFWPPYSLDGVFATLVEPVHMKELKETYSKWSAKLADLHYENFRFVEKAINEDESINDEGNCVFYTVADTCPMKMKWLSQISGLDPAPMKKVFKEKSDVCIQENTLPCVTISGLLVDSGHNITAQLSPSSRQQQWCHPIHTENSKPMADVLVVDAEGFDGQVLTMVLKDLCPALWPAIIIYEDKILRESSRETNFVRSEININTLDDDVLDTEEADNMIDFLEQRGYYVLLVGEDVMALRVGYAIDAMRHSLYDPPDLSIFRQKAWLHPRSGRTVQ